MELDSLLAKGKALQRDIPIPPPSDSDAPTALPHSRWAFLFAFMKPSHRRTLLIASISSIGSGAIFPLFAVVLGYIFSAFSDYESGRISVTIFLARIALYARYLCAFAMVSWILRTVCFVSSQRFGELQAMAAQHYIFNGMLAREMACRMREVQLATSEALGSVLQFVSMAIVATSIALYTAWDLTLVVLVTLPISIIALNFLSRRLQPILMYHTSERGVAVQITNTAMSAIQMVKSYAGQEFEVTQYTRSLSRASEHFIEQTKISALYLGLIRFISLAIFVQGFCYGSWLVQKRSKTSGEIVTVFWACLISTQALQAILPQMITLRRGWVAAEQLRKIASKAPNDRSLPMYTAPPETARFRNGNIELTDVSINYPGGASTPILDGICMFFPEARTTFIVGRSGSGKSTLANLFSGFYRFSGEIHISGKPILDMSTEQFRRHITVVQQQPQLFSDDILGNIALGLENSSEVLIADIQECVALAALEDDIAQLPQRLRTHLGHLGHALSGGQRQRVALARARLRNTPILILDEATSALDEQMAKEVMDNIRAWRQNKTTIIITHDLGQILPHDYLYVLENGRVVQEGYRNTLEKSMIGPFYDLLGSNAENSRRLSELSYNSPIRLPRSYSQSSTQSFMDFLQTQGSINVMSRIETMVRSDATTSEHSNPEELSMEQTPSQRITRGNKDKSRPPERSVVEVLGTSWSYLDRGHRRKLFTGFLFASLHAMATPIFSWCFSRLLSTYFDQSDGGHQSASTWSVAILLVALMDGCASYFMHLFLECCGQSWIDGMRKRAFRQILGQPCSWFDENGYSAHRLSQGLDQEAEEVRNLLSRFTGSLFVVVVMILIAITGAFAVCWKLTLAGFVLTSIVFAVAQFCKRASIRLEESSYEASQIAVNVFVETFTNIQTVKTYTLEDLFRSRHSRALFDAMTIGRKKAMLSGIHYGSSDAVVILILAFLFWYGSLLVSSGEYPVQSIITVLSMLVFTLTSVSTIVTQIPQITTSTAAASRLLHLVELPPAPPPTPPTTSPAHSAHPPSITLTNLSFTYPSRRTHPVLKNLTLTIPLGASTAITGPSGCGKSTLLALLARLYPPDPSPSPSPTTTTFTTTSTTPPLTFPPELRLSDIVLSPQNPPLLPTTLAANIAYALPPSHSLASLDNISRAASEAGLGPFISSLPDGLQTTVGEEGMGLSGGQRSQLGLARALCRRRKVLLLDEPTAGLDKEGRRGVMGVIGGFVERGGTVVVVSHDLEVVGGCGGGVKLGGEW